MSNVTSNDVNDDSPDNEPGAAKLREFSTALLEGRAEDAQTAGLDFLKRAINRMDQEPSQDLLLKQEAHRREGVGDWEGAELLYQEALSLAEAQDHIGSIFAAHHDLSRFYTFLGRDHAALEQALRAIAVAHRSKMGPTMSALLLLELIRRAECELRVGDVSAARRTILEMLEQVQDRPTFMSHKAYGLVVLARCELENGQTFEAEQHLEVAWHLLAPLAPALIFASVHIALANWWETRAQVRKMRGDTSGAVAASREAVDCSRHVASLPQLDGPYKFKWLSDALCNLGHALSEAGETVLAVEALAESNGIRQAIGLPIPNA